MIKKNMFRGPLFIVGMPRSGTKLLRDLLNQNPSVGIPIAESNFIPKMIRQYGDPPELQEAEMFDSFYNDYTQTSFFWWMRRFGYEMSKEYLDGNADKTSWRSVFETIIRYHAPEGRETDFIWGDKTPSYLYHLKQLKGLYPEAKILHIIRDPRDYCLSRFKAWGTHLYSSAEMWREGIEVARKDGGQMGNDYMEIYFESLLDGPESILRKICAFLECEFRADMLELGRACENLGDAKGETKIIKHNKKKYPGQLSRNDIKRIEAIVYPAMMSTPYQFEYAEEYKPVSALQLNILGKLNMYKRLLFDVKEKGVVEGLRYRFGFFKRTGSE